MTEPTPAEPGAVEPPAADTSTAAAPAAPPPPPPPPPPGYAPAAPYPGYPPGTYPGYPPPGYPAPPATSGKATAAMVLGIVGVFGWCFYGMGVIAGILALVFGYQARREIRSGSWERGPIGGGGQATAGIVLGWVTIGLTIAAIVVIAVALVASSSGSPNGY